MIRGKRLAALARPATPVDHIEEQFQEMLAERRAQRVKVAAAGKAEYTLPPASNTETVYHVAHDGWPLEIDKDRELRFINWIRGVPFTGIPRAAVNRAQESFARGRRFGPYNRGQQDHKSWDKPRNIYSSGELPE